MSQPVVVITEQRQGKLNPASFETISAGQKLAAALGAPLAAVVLEGAASGLAAELATRQLDRVLRAQHAHLAEYAPDVWVQALVQVISEAKPSYVLFPHTYQVRDYAPRLATRLGRGLVSDATGFRLEGDRLLLTRPMFQGKWTAEVLLLGEGPGLVSFQLGTFRGDQAEMGAAPAPIVEIAVSPSGSQLKPGEIFQEAKQAVDLSQAAKIVAVGRGIKEEKNLALARELAEALGAELAASRPICDSGWLPMDRQIGSSGQTVAPKLYLALGISGAIQHLVGMKGSRTIVAVNKDPEAPIFEAADYGIVGDLFEVVPAMIAELKK